MSFQKGQLIPSFLDLKNRIIYTNPAFQPSVIVSLDTSSRDINTPLNNPSWTLPIPVKGAYAISSKSASIPITWNNVASTKQFEVTYGAVTAFPVNFELTPGWYDYGLEDGLITYAMAIAAPSDQYLDNLVYVLLRQMGGAIA